MKSSYILFGIITFLSTSFLTVDASIITVCKSCEVSSIKGGIAIAQPHDTVLIKSGEYFERAIIIDKPLTLIGEDLPIIDAEFEEGIFEIRSDSVILDGLQIQKVGVSYTKDFAAILINRSENFEIRNCVLKDVFFGILIEKSHYGKIYDNNISSQAVEQYNSGNGVHGWHCTNLEIMNNELSNLRDGIYLEFVNESKIYGNFSHDNLRYGLHFMFSNHDDYFDNVFTQNGAGVAVMFSKFINMKRNHFFKNWGTASYGLLLKEIYDAEIDNNIFEENTIGIFVEGSTRVNYVRNDFKRNGWALKIAGGCYTNKFLSNNFLNNSFDVSYNTKMNDNGFEGNFWSSYSGYDLDKDGIGDVPYRPVKLFSYVVNRTPETIILLHSLFIDMLNFSERVSPVFTPDNLVDPLPKTHIIND
jgi:nitrous oxidase accessory protein